MNTELFEKYANGSLTAAEAAILAQQLAEHPALADQFAAATRLEADLTGAFKEQARTALYTRRMERVVEEDLEPATAARNRWLRPVAVAAGFALVSGACWAWLHETADNIAQHGNPAPRRGSGGDTPPPSTGGDAAVDASMARMGAAAALKRQLGKFAASSAALHNVPVSQALAHLEQQWREYPHRDEKQKNVTFALSTAARNLWLKPEDEPSVSLEIPGISLLTSLDLVAAQAGLLTKVSGAGVSLEPETRKDDGQPRSWTLPLAAATFDAFLTRSRGEQQQVEQELVQQNPAAGYFIQPLLTAAQPTWWGQADAGANQGQVILGVDAWNEVRVHLPGSEPMVSYVKDAPAEVIFGRNYIESLSEPTALGEPANPAYESFSRLFTMPNGLNVMSGDDAVSTDDLIESGPPAFSADSGIPAPDATAQTHFLDTVPYEPSGTFKLMTALNEITVANAANNSFWKTRSTALAVPPAETLSHILTAHHVDAANVRWDSDNGSVTARGTLRELRTASATLAAMRESASAGVSVEVKFIEWQDGTVPPLTAGEEKSAQGSTVISAADAAALTRLADQSSSVVAYPRVLSLDGKSVDMNSTVTPDAKQPEVRVGSEVKMTARSVPGTALTVSGNVVRRSVAGEEVVEGQTRLVPSAAVGSFNCRLEEGHSLRVDVPGTGSSKPVTVLISAQRTTLLP